MRSVPSWLQEKLPPPGPQAAARRSSKRGFLEKTLQAIAEALQNEIFSESLASRPGLLQGLDPRAKLVTILFLIGIAGVLHHIFSCSCSIYGFSGWPRAPGYPSELS